MFVVAFGNFSCIPSPRSLDFISNLLALDQVTVLPTAALLLKARMALFPGPMVESIGAAHLQPDTEITFQNVGLSLPLAIYNPRS